MILISFLLVALTIVALIDIVGQEESTIRNLPKIVWVLLVVFLPLIGVGFWFLLGKDWSKSRIKLPQRRAKNGRPRGSYGPMPSTPSAPNRAVSDTEDQLAALDREIQAAEDAERIRRLEAEFNRRDDDTPPTDHR